MSLAIVMYHYVREIKNSKYPGIKGLEIADFEEQVMFLKKNYQCLSTDDVVEHILEKRVFQKIQPI